MTSVDNKGRPYAKIDCTTRVQNGKPWQTVGFTGVRNSEKTGEK